MFINKNRNHCSQHTFGQQEVSMFAPVAWKLMVKDSMNSWKAFWPPLVESLWKCFPHKKLLRCLKK